MDVFKLVLTRKGRLGPRLRRTSFNCEESTANAPKDETGKSICRRGFEFRGAGGMANRWLHGSGDVRRLIWDLQFMRSERVIIDGTALRGFYTWDVFNPLDKNRPDQSNFWSEVRDQLGLQLEPGRAPVDVVVIDAVRMPTPN